MVGVDEELEEILKSYAKKIYNSIGKGESKFQEYTSPIHVDNSKTFYKIISENKVVVVDFWAEWCMPCQVYAPMFEEAAKKLRGKAVFVRVNVDEAPEIAREYGVLSVPTTIVFVEGKPVDWIVGAIPEDVLEVRVKRFISS